MAKQLKYNSRAAGEFSCWVGETALREAQRRGLSPAEYAAALTDAAAFSVTQLVKSGASPQTALKVYVQTVMDNFEQQGIHEGVTVELTLHERQEQEGEG